MKCPILSYQKQYTYEIDCMGKQCAWADQRTGECLIAKKLRSEIAAIDKGSSSPSEPHFRDPAPYFSWGGQ